MSVDNVCKKTAVIKYDIRHIPIAQYPINIRNDEKSEQRTIMCGGFGKTESHLHELISNEQENKLQWHDLGIDLIDIGCRYGLNVISLMTSDSSKLILIKPYNGVYNVYNFSFKTWMINQGKKIKLKIFNLGGMGQRYIFINDDILVISHKKQLHFYNISNVLEPKLMKNYTITSDIPDNTKDGYVHHGMCMINCTLSKNCKELFCSFIVFGGCGHVPFESSFVQFDVIFDYCFDVNNGMTINPQIIENKIYQVNLFQVSKNLTQLYHFSCHCVDNDKNEKIVVIIGGFNDDSYETGNCVFLYNVSTSTLTESPTV